MMNTLGIVHVDHDTNRAGHKAGRKLGGKSLLEWVVRRVTDSQRLDAVVVVLADSPLDRPISELVPSDVPVFVGPQRDLLGRVLAAVEAHPAKAVVRVSAENPFIDPEWIDRLAAEADSDPNCDYLGYCSRDGRPATLSPLGVLAEWCRVEALRRADREITRAGDRQQLGRYLYSHPKKFKVRLIPAPAELDRDDVRLKIDYEEDWEHAQVIYEALGHEEWDWRRLAGLLDHQPALRRRMAVLNRNEARV